MVFPTITHTPPLLILKGTDSVGFALVTRPAHSPMAGEKAADYRMSEFFIRMQYRRAGIGRRPMQRR